MARYLRRSFEDRWVAGVCAGLAHHFDVDTTVVRVAFVFVPGAWLLYLFLWVWLPTGSTAAPR